MNFEPGRVELPANPAGAAGAEPYWWLATFRALRHRNYRLYFGGQMVSLIGSWVQTTALMWLAWDLTKQSIWPALIVAAQIVPSFLLGPWGGALADRWPRRPLIMATQAAFLVLALLLWLLTWLGHIASWQLLAVSLLAGLVNAIDLPARLAFVMDMVGRDDLPNAVALNSLLFNAARAVGPAASAWLLEHVTAAECFLVNGLSFVAVLFALAWMDPLRATSLGKEKTDGSFRATYFFLRERRHLVLLLALTGAMAFFGWPVLTLLPALAEHQLTAGHKEFSGLVSAIGVGALGAALLVATVDAMTWRKGLLTGGIVLTATGLAGLSLAETIPWARAWCLLIGAGLITYLATGQTVVQLSAADHNRGRVMGVWLMMLSGGVPVGNLVAGAAADWMGPARVLRIFAGGIALSAGTVFAFRYLLAKDATADRPA